MDLRRALGTSAFCLSLLASGCDEVDPDDLRDATADLSPDARAGEVDASTAEASPGFPGNADPDASPAPMAEAGPADFGPALADAGPADGGDDAGGYWSGDKLPEYDWNSGLHDPSCSSGPMFGPDWDYNAYRIPNSDPACPVCSPFSKQGMGPCDRAGLVCGYVGSNVSALCGCQLNSDVAVGDAGGPGMFGCAL